MAPASIAEIGHAGQANHQYDLSDFSRALDAGRMPAVSYKPPVYQNGHAQSSDPLDEQHFLVARSTASSPAGTGSQPRSSSPTTTLTVGMTTRWARSSTTARARRTRCPATVCGARTPAVGYQDRCGYGPRQPLLLISPCSRINAIDHHVTAQTSILRFVEDNWLGGQRIGDGSFDALAGSLDGLVDFSHPHRQPLYLDPSTGRHRR